MYAIFNLLRKTGCLASGKMLVIAPLRAASQGRPDDPAVWFALGAAHASLRDLPAARVALERTVALAPGVAAAWGRLGSVCLALGDSAAAAGAFERAQALEAAGAGAP